MVKQLLSLIMIILVFSCGQPNLESTSDKKTDKKKEMTGKVPNNTDTHSFSKPQNAFASHLKLNITIDFENKKVAGTARFDIKQPKPTGEIIFDTKSLNIEKVTLDNNEETTFSKGEEIDAIHGKSLIVKIKPETRNVTIYYSTNTESDALQWLNPQQTAGKKHPYLFTQGEAILTRSWIPIQDSPGIRITYDAKVQVPKELMAVMSANNPQNKNNTGVYHFEMKQSIPCYLIALAVGDLKFEKLGNRTGVYTEPSMLAKCAKEFEDLEKMVEAAEGLYGPYRWERYDVIVLPPSFPFGGMENPRLTFATPTIIAGDKSLVGLIAHELAHSWSGNLVTNQTWDDFWLNEGFTVYFENRIMEAVYGKGIAAMSDQLNYQDLLKTINSFGDTHKDTHLKLNLNGRNPDDAMTDITYNKGALFLTNLEKKVGREKWDEFITSYFNNYSFKSVTTEDFVTYLNENLLEPNNTSFNTEDWIYGPGIPINHNRPEAVQFEIVNKTIQAWANGKQPKELATNKWSTFEWLHFINNLPNSTTKDQLANLDKTFNFTNSTNSEIAAAWFERAINSNYMVIKENLESFLINVGRRKFLVPLYKSLIENNHFELAERIYKIARPNTITFQQVQLMTSLHVQRKSPLLN